MTPNEELIKEFEKEFEKAAKPIEKLNKIVNDYIRADESEELILAAEKAFDNVFDRAAEKCTEAYRNYKKALEQFYANGGLYKDVDQVIEKIPEDEKKAIYDFHNYEYLKYDALNVWLDGEWGAQEPVVNQSYDYDFYEISFQNFQEAVEQLYDKGYAHKDVDLIIKESIIDYLSSPYIKHSDEQREFLQKEAEYCEGKYKMPEKEKLELKSAEDINIYQKCKESVSDLYACVNVTKSKIHQMAKEIEEKKKTEKLEGKPKKKESYKEKIMKKIKQKKTKKRTKAKSR